MKRPCGIPSSRHAFTLVEVMVVSVLLAALGLLLSEAWVGMGRPLLDAATHARLAEEASLAVAALTRDLGGYSGENAGRLGTQAQLKFVGRLQPGGTQLWLCFDGGATPNGIADWGAPDTVIVYQVVGNSLIRTDQTSGLSYTVARNVGSLAVSDLGNAVQIVLTFLYRSTVHTYTLIANNP
jgi:prepilin-type N-terminal cleavage/methylation domain-containing protein